jgi:cullin 1
LNFEIGQFTVAEILATYTDNILRKNGLKVPPDQFEAHLEKVVKLFSHLTDKDIFIESFKNFMAKRLLSEKSESIDYEKSIVTKIKMTCGRTVTDSIEGMMSDLELAKDHAKRYQESRLSKGQPDPIDFDIKILTTSYWPTYKSFELSVPQEIKSCMDSFTEFYTKQPTNHHRELKWNFAMGSAIVSAKLPGTNKPYDLVVSTYQMCVLYIFNYYKELTLAEIAEHMGFDEETAKKNINSLMLKNTRILTQENGKYKVNLKFHS